jgi:Phage derived protein Gp49-like (DUF891)
MAGYGELRELRCHYGPVLYRVLYRRSRNLFILLHMLRKNTGKISASDVGTARTRWEDSRLGWMRSRGGLHARPAMMLRRPPPMLFTDFGKLGGTA